MTIDLDQMFMQRAIKQAMRARDADEVPVGCVIVHEGQIIAQAYNQVELLKDPTAHAEMIAITQAANALQLKWLLHCTVYVTLEPCSMCAGALVLARAKRLVFGASDPKTGACGSLANIVQDVALNHQIDVTQGVLADQCGFLLTDFFEQKRKKPLE